MKNESHRLLEFLAGRTTDEVCADLLDPESEASRTLRAIRTAAQDAFRWDVSETERQCVSYLAGQKLWEHYLNRLTCLAEAALGEVLASPPDKERAAEVLSGFWRGAKRGRYPLATEPDDLWMLLVKIAAQLRGDQQDFKRTGPQQEDTVSAAVAPTAEARKNANVPEPTREFAGRFAATCLRCFRSLSRAKDGLNLCEVALWRMEGYTAAEIAAGFESDEALVYIRLIEIKECWTKEYTAQEGSQDDFGSTDPATYGKGEPGVKSGDGAIGT